MASDSPGGHTGEQREAGAPLAREFAPLYCPPDCFSAFLRDLPSDGWTHQISSRNHNPAFEAAHRARNLAQLAASLNNCRQRRSGFDVEAARRLSAELTALYLVIAETNEGARRTECQGLHISNVSAVGLYDSIIGDVRITTRLDPLTLAPLRRRALHLIGSEMVINALRHSSADGTGRMPVRLAKRRQHCPPAVDDNGLGLAEAPSAGTGSRLLADLAETMNGSLRVIRTHCRGMRLEVQRGGEWAALARSHRAETQP